jgi:hypothetical protein
VKFEKWSALLCAVLLLASLALTTNAIAKTLNVNTINHTVKAWKVKECINNKHCVNFRLVDREVMNFIIEPSSGSATVEAQFVEISTPAYHPTCQSKYNVNKKTKATVTVSGSGPFICSIAMQ